MDATHAGETREQPRERLARLGAEALASRELVSVVLGTGARGTPALAVADELLSLGLHALAARSLPELERTYGLGRAKASRLIAAIELGARLASDPGAAPSPLDGPRAVGRVVSPLRTGCSSCS